MQDARKKSWQLITFSVNGLIFVFVLDKLLMLSEGRKYIHVLDFILITQYINSLLLICQ